MPGTVHYCSGSGEGQIMDFYHNVSILGGSIKDKGFLDQLSDCQLIKEDYFIKAVFKRIRNYGFQNFPYYLLHIRPSVRPSVTACDKQPDSCALFLTLENGTDRWSRNVGNKLLLLAP